MFLVVVLERPHQQNLGALSVRNISIILHKILGTEQYKCVFINVAIIS